MKQLFSALAVLMMLAVPAAYAKDNYISDELFTYMHSGPGTQYRIIGSVDAGTKVTVVDSNRNAGYSQIIDDRGRKGWVETKYVSNQPGLKIRVPALEEELKQVKEALARAQGDTEAKTKGLITSLEQRNAQVKELEQHTSELNQKLIDAQTEIRELRARIDTQKDDLLMRYFTYGGIVAGGGLLFGLILPHLIPRRKKRNSGWA
ncbi:TIGR04211 family SH3 domain-containing protein [Grimontia hollisae]|uniref:Arylsulfatase n=2 Tax=Grimontia hollisae TaxID=673 RepID=D0I8B8_GRIHO|nr:TIGR04211 family SH3 domain-containing protein [Grimontia hollisae]AMG30997.1 TIGR04211 family SH3 domain-containing protein [Grimontia hollisae]EEY72887.1 arylsulfatase [Grimontia hollisae CIP 101886]MDF2186605.1 TIGR04211 family SH3 domain-containing protein [Grimontia hollisae]STO46929.1 SH3 domain-containing protein [Grimontia hollisae]STO56189.1 SH3 domain-containing protein [Grimontia hollisae]